MKRGAPLLAALAFAGCSPSLTAVRVTLFFDPGVSAASLSVTVAVEMPAMTLAMNQTIQHADGSRIHRGDDFVVILPDAMAGQKVVITAQTTELGIHLWGSNAAIIARGQTVPMDVDLTTPKPDLGADLPGDGPPPDLRAAADDLATLPELGVDGDVDSGADLALDFALGPDLTPGPPDLTQQLDLAPCTPSMCDRNQMPNVLYECNDAGQSVTSCAFGCAPGAGCVRPDRCTSADISGGGVFHDNISDLTHTSTGSCDPMGTGPDARFQLTLSDWETVIIDTKGSNFDTVLWARTVCDDPTSELPLAGPCNPKPMGTWSCNDDRSFMDRTSMIKLCGVPPTTLSVWLAAKGMGNGGPFTLNVNLSQPVSLNSCNEAGMLIPGLLLSASTVGHANNFASVFGPPCDLDDGSTSPDAVFYFTLLQPHNVTITTNSKNVQFPHLLYIRKDGCPVADFACDDGLGGAATLQLDNLMPATYYVFVDGRGGSTGDFQIRLAFN